MTKYVWKKINDSINDTVNGIMLDALVEKSRQLGPGKTDCGKACSSR